jgi:hypothetical protein
MEHVLAREEPNVLFIKFVHQLIFTLVAGFVRLVASTESFAELCRKVCHFLANQLDSAVKDADEVHFGLDLLLEDSAEVIVLQSVACVFEETNDRVEVYVFRHLLKEVLVADQNELLKLHFFLVPLSVRR